jgi:hypothetical protein
MVSMIKDCLNCGKEIKVKPSHFERKKFCSRKCKGEFQTKHPEAFEHLKTQKMVPCDNCGKKVFRKPSVLKNHNHVFCNQGCKAEYQSNHKDELFSSLRKERITLKCEECRKNFNVIPSRFSIAKYCSKECLGKANGRRAKVVLPRRIVTFCDNCPTVIFKKPSEITEHNFCSIECMGEYYARTGMFAGINSGTWLGGDINYYGPNWREQRRKARKRDNYTCQDCGKTEAETESELSVHHLIPFRKFNGDWKKANQLSNLITLCEHPCHRKRHSKMVNDIV